MSSHTTRRAPLHSAGATGQLQAGIDFCTRSPDLLKAILTFAACSALGQCFIFLLVSEFGALVTTTTTTVRKIFSTVLSVFRYNEQLSQQSWTGCFVVFGGIVLDTAMKFAKSKKKK